MANLYNNASSNYYAPQEPDEISLFLQQILLRSSSSSSSHSFSRHQSLLPTSEHVAPEQMVGQISASEPLSGLKSCSTRSFAAAENVSPNSAANLGNETDDCDYESEEVVEALVSETAARSVPPRCSSKRSRAAEVHNLSEKRRRSRINEKMKALQNLIPNSNKTDKASMLDEAIEYLKQLQLQVQMLTMRNGLSLYPVCLPGMLPNQVSQTRVDACDTDKYLNVNMTKEMSLNQNISLLSLPKNCVKQEHVSDFSRMISKNSVDVESSMMQHHLGAFQLSRSFKKKEKVLPCLPLVEDGFQLQGCSAGGKETCVGGLKDESCVAADILLTKYVDNSPVFSHRN